jgi:peptide-methionine (S)-S-oxide reductase
VVRTRVGYTGGRTPNPTYRNLGDHTESFQVDYDPKEITYEQLLEMFWASNNHCAQAWSRQYISAVFYGNDEQQRLALKTKAQAAARQGRPVTTEVQPLGTFYVAEDYHQKYLLRRKADLMREFRAMYPSDADFMNSTAAARVNGFVAGNGTPEQLEKEIDSYGLSPDGMAQLRVLVKRRW